MRESEKHIVSIQEYKALTSKAIGRNAKLQQTIADITAERNAWREDADDANMWLDTYHEHTVFDDKCETCQAMMKTLDHHRQLHVRYPTEKSDTDKGEMK